MPTPHQLYVNELRRHDGTPYTVLTVQIGACHPIQLRRWRDGETKPQRAFREKLAQWSEGRIPEKGDWGALRASPRAQEVLLPKALPEPSSEALCWVSAPLTPKALNTLRLKLPNLRTEAEMQTAITKRFPTLKGQTCQDVFESWGYLVHAQEEGGQPVLFPVVPMIPTIRSTTEIASL